MPPRPTTSRRSVLSGTALSPHGESHDINGVDPVLDDITFLGNTTVTATFSTTSTTFVDVTDLTLSVVSRGGLLLIMAAGPRKSIDNTVGSGIGCGIRVRAVVDSTNQSEYVDRFDTILDGASTADETGHWSSGTYMWVATVAPGVHTVKIQIRNDNGSSAEFPCDEGDANLLVFELLPLRRA